MAYVGSPRRNSVGGICTPGRYTNNVTLEFVCIGEILFYAPPPIYLDIERLYIPNFYFFLVPFFSMHQSRTQLCVLKKPELRKWRIRRILKEYF